MITAPPGDFPGLPLSPAGRAIAMAWDPKTDGSCKAFGAAALMRIPTRVRISWADDATLKIETDNGQQTRLLHSVPAARRVRHRCRAIPRPIGSGRCHPTIRSGSTSQAALPRRPAARCGSSRPISAAAGCAATVCPTARRPPSPQFFDRFPVPDGSEWFVVTTQVVDPEYLLGRLVTSSHFRREPDASKWAPKPCRT